MNKDIIQDLNTISQGLGVLPESELRKKIDDMVIKYNKSLTTKRYALELGGWSDGNDLHFIEITAPNPDEVKKRIDDMVKKKGPQFVSEALELSAGGCDFDEKELDRAVKKIYDGGVRIDNLDHWIVKE